MKLFEADWNPKKFIEIPELSLITVDRMRKSNIGTVFSDPGCRDLKFILINDQEDLAEMHSILGINGDWEGTIDDQLLLRALTGFIESHPKQEGFCFVATES